MADSEDEMEAKLAAGGAEGTAAFVELARSFYELGGSEALSRFVAGRFGVMKPADQNLIVMSVLGSYFEATQKTRH